MLASPLQTRQGTALRARKGTEMTNKIGLKSRKALVVKVVVACLCVCMVQCGNEHVTADEEIASVAQALTCGSLACTSTPTCTLAANVPLCAETVSARCHSASGQCVWKIKTDPNCPCIENSVQLCNVDPTTPGVSVCTANAGRTATYWAACTACASCT